MPNFLRRRVSPDNSHENFNIEFIHIRMDVLIATDFCNREVQSC